MRESFERRRLSITKREGEHLPQAGRHDAVHFRRDAFRCSSALKLRCLSIAVRSEEHAKAIIAMLAVADMFLFAVGQLYPAGYKAEESFISDVLGHKFRCGLRLQAPAAFPREIPDRP